MGPACDHDWRWVDTFIGDANVVNGTMRVSYYECRLCGEEDHERDPPEDDDWGLD